MPRLPYKSGNEEATPNRKILGHTPKILESVLLMEEAISEILNPEIMELVRLRVATNNDCKFCKRFINYDLDQEKRTSALEKHSDSILSTREQLAIELVDRIMGYHGDLPEEMFNRLKVHFSTEEIIALFYQIGIKNTGGWFNIAMEID